MTFAVQRLGATAPEAGRTTLWTALAFAAGVLMILTYSQVWVAPLLGGQAVDPAMSGLIRSLFYPAYAAGLFVLATHPAGVAQALRRSPMLLLLLVLVAASTLWSVAPDTTARRAVALAFTTLGGVALAARFGWRTLAEVFATAHAVLALTTLAVCLALPDVGVMTELFPGAWRGLWAEKNTLGANMSMASLVFAAAAIGRPERRGVWIGFTGLAVFLVLMSTSKTSLLALALGFAALGFVGLVRRGPVLGVATTWTAVVGVLVLGLGAVFAADAVFELLGKDATLTGRTPVWEAALRQVQTRPWTGFGYGAVWDNLSAWSPRAWIGRDSGYFATHAHNGWLEVWLGFGLVGVAVWAVYLLEVWGRTLWATYARLGEETGAYLALPTLAMFTLMTLTESVVINYNDLRWVLFTAVAVKLAAPLASVRR